MINSKNFVEYLRETAKKSPKRIVFSEQEDPRVKGALQYIERERSAIPVVVNKDNLNKDKIKQFAAYYVERRKAKAISMEEAEQVMADPLFYGAMLCKTGEADGFVAGAKYTTSSVARSAIYCLDPDDESGLICSCFIMVLPQQTYGMNGIFIYADCGLIPYPTSEQLALIGINAAKFFKKVTASEPRVAFLSFSSKGSAEGRWVDKVRDAVSIAQQKNSGFLLDGELQADAAIVPEVAAIKVKDSPVAGKANILIFPNLDAGNICYKLTERLGGARAIGPLILGMKQPCSDLSRGCKVDDVIDCTAVTVLRAYDNTGH